MKQIESNKLNNLTREAQNRTVISWTIIGEYKVTDGQKMA